MRGRVSNMRKMKMVSVTDLKKSTAAVLREARESGQTIAVVKNNQIEGYYTPAGLLEIERASSKDVAQALTRVMKVHGDTLARLAKK